MKWLRSAEMEYITLIVNEDAAHDCIQRLGELGAMEFTDLNSELTPFQRRYVSYVRRCDEMERILRYFEQELEKFSIKAQSPGSIENFLKSSEEVRYGSQDTAMRALDTLERLLEDKEKELLQLNSMHTNLTREYNERKELQEVISKAGEFFAIDLPEISSRTTSRVSRISGVGLRGGMSPLLPEPGTAGEDLALRFRNITGVVPADDRNKFERMIFRATRGNVYTRFSLIEDPIMDPTTGNEVEKYAFVIFFQSEFIESKLRKICDAFNARLYTLPSVDDRTALTNLMQTNNVELNQSNHILRKNRESCVLLCRELAEHLHAWKWTVNQEKATYHTMNTLKADVSGMLRGEGWVIKSRLDDVRYEVTKAHNSEDKSMPSYVDLIAKPWPVPPTYFETNKFTEAYQAFVDTYGIPRYREINPAVFTAVTFPFLYGVMYGDIGHGTCVFLFGMYLIMTEKRLEQGNIGEMATQIYGGRYMIMMMGAFAMYAGLIYNDFFAIALNLFGSKYDYPEGCHSDNRPSKCQATRPNGTTGDNVYPFGLDPIWKTSDEELLFFNSFKMKMSVIIGIIQMSFGICLKGWNAIHFRQHLDFFFEFIPQLLFALSLFGYMAVMIVWKWTIDWNERGSHKTCPLNFGKEHTGCRPPGLINTLINIALKPFDIEDPMFDNQLLVQQILLLIALICIPVMLLVKPIVLSLNKPRIGHVEHQVDYEVDVEGKTHSAESGHDDHEEHTFGELMIHQTIETIEFVLGMISNTASYLRLWALSLAHAELALVFWEKAMLTTINMGNPLFVFIGFAVFAAVTTGVLLMMDVLECFLHALRLHWVEFQNKFYKADGHQFEPLCFRRVLRGEA